MNNEIVELFYYLYQVLLMQTFLLFSFFCITKDAVP